MQTFKRLPDLRSLIGRGRGELGGVRGNVTRKHCTLMAKEVFFYSSSDDIPHLGGKKIR